MLPAADEDTGPKDGAANSGDRGPLNSGAVKASRLTPGQVPHRWPEWTALTLFAGLVGFAIPWHEPWSDEAQSWQLARSLSLPDLFVKYVRYEGSPGLWHLLLWALSRLHVSYSGLHWICGAIAVASTSLLVFYSPFPRYLRLILPFTYFLAFQYAIIARSYVLVPWMLFLLAFWWRKGPLRIAILLGLLANVSLHASVISGGLAIVYAIEQYRHRRSWDSVQRRKLLYCALIILGFYAIAIWTAWPAQDMPLSRVRGESRGFLLHAIESLVGGICQPWLLSIPFWIVMGWWFRARKCLVYLLPVAFFSAFSGAVFAAWWHMGLLVPLILCLLWITWPESEPRTASYAVAGRLALIYMAGVQALWLAFAVSYDHFHAFAPDLEAAQFLKPYVLKGARIAVTSDYCKETQAFNSVGILPYFDRPIFLNQPGEFWWWSANNQTEARFVQLLPTHPDIVVVETIQTHPGPPLNFDEPNVAAMIKMGYTRTRVYCGSIPERLDFLQTMCHSIFQYSPKAGSETP
jgi:hypothetical protein